MDNPLDSYLACLAEANRDRGVVRHAPLKETHAMATAIENALFEAFELEET